MYSVLCIHCKPPNFCDVLFAISRRSPNRQSQTSQILIYKTGCVLVLVRTSGEIRNRKRNTSWNGPNFGIHKRSVSQKLGGVQCQHALYSKL